MSRRSRIRHLERRPSGFFFRRRVPLPVLSAQSSQKKFLALSLRTHLPRDAVRFQEAFGTIDVRASLPKVQAPTIVFHARDDQRISIEQGRELAIGIPGAEFVPLDSKNHILLGQEPAWTDCVQRTGDFLRKHGL